MSLSAIQASANSAGAETSSACNSGSSKYRKPQSNNTISASTQCPMESEGTVALGQQTTFKLSRATDLVHGVTLVAKLSQLTSDATSGDSWRYVDLAGLNLVESYKLTVGANQLYSGTFNDIIAAHDVGLDGICISTANGYLTTLKGDANGVPTSAMRLITPERASQLCHEGPLKVSVQLPVLLGGAVLPMINSTFHDMHLTVKFATAALMLACDGEGTYTTADVRATGAALADCKAFARITQLGSTEAALWQASTWKEWTNEICTYTATAHVTTGATQVRFSFQQLLKSPGFVLIARAYIAKGQDVSAAATYDCGEADGRIAATIPPYSMEMHLGHTSIGEGTTQRTWNSDCSNDIMFPNGEMGDVTTFQFGPIVRDNANSSSAVNFSTVDSVNFILTTREPIIAAGSANSSATVGLAVTLVSQNELIAQKGMIGLKYQPKTTQL